MARKRRPLKVEPEKVWFTSDTHFNHANICQYSNRPFESLEAMEEHIIAVWNSQVGSDDLVFHLGDFALSYGKRDADKIDKYLSRLNGNKFLVIGNHDREEVYNNKRWNGVERMHEIKIDLGGEHAQRIVLCHYAMRTWNQSHRGSWMLHGHSHGGLPDEGGKTLDVGVDCSLNYAPINLTDIAKVMDCRRVVLSGDHHE